MTISDETLDRLVQLADEACMTHESVTHQSCSCPNGGEHRGHYLDSHVGYLADFYTYSYPDRSLEKRRISPFMLSEQRAKYTAEALNAILPLIEEVKRLRKPTLWQRIKNSFRRRPTANEAFIAALSSVSDQVRADKKEHAKQRALVRYMGGEAEETLTHGKVYEVLSVEPSQPIDDENDNHDYMIVNDKGEPEPFITELFEPAESDTRLTCNVSPTG